MTGSTPLQRIRDEYNPARPSSSTRTRECVEQLKNGQVDAVTTDEAILVGYAAQDPDDLKVVGEPFSEERYGVGLAKGDTALQEHINTLFTDGGDVWTAIFEENLAPAGIEGDAARRSTTERRSGGGGRRAAAPARTSATATEEEPWASIIDNTDLWREGLSGTLVLFFVRRASSRSSSGSSWARCASRPSPIARTMGALYVNIDPQHPADARLLLLRVRAAAAPAADARSNSARCSRILALGIYTATYVAETHPLRHQHRAGRAGRGGSRASGMTFGQVMSLVVLPQAFRSVIPPMMSVLHRAAEEHDGRGGLLGRQPRRRSATT